MRNIKVNKFFIISLLLLFSFTITNAQGGNNFDKPKTDLPDRQDRLREFLGLSDEQVMQIQMIRREQAPLLRDARMRQQQTRQKLDEAIYANEFIEADVEKNLRNFLEAQAEVTKLRIMNETAVRRVLTPEQLEKFIMFRQRLKDRRDNRNNLRQTPGQNQNRRRNLPKN